MTDNRRENDLLIGQLLAQVSNLAEEVKSLREQVATLSTRMNTGRGLLYGALFAAGGMGASISALAEKVFK